MLRTIDRVPTKVLDNGAVRYGIYDDKGALIRYEYIKREDEPSVPGDAINRELFEDFLDVGTIIQTDSDLSNDDRFLPCDGRFLQQNEYPQLYGNIGNKYEESFTLIYAVDGTSNYSPNVIKKGDFDRGVGGPTGFNKFYNNRDFLFDDVFVQTKSTDYIYEIIGYETRSYGYAVKDTTTNDTIRFNNLIITANNSGIFTTDGVDNNAVWTSRLAVRTFALTYNDKLIVALCADSSNVYIYSSTDGIAWTKRLTVSFSSISSSYCHIKYKKGVFLAKMMNKLYRSADGTNWTDVTPSNITVANSYPLYNTEKYFIINATSSFSYSTDGLTWTTRNVGLTDVRLGQLVVGGKFYDIDGGFRIPFAKGRWIKVK